MKNLILLFFIFLILSSFAQTKRAIIIGIGSYPLESGWNKIHGDNDVPLITSVLTSKGFILNNINCLTNEKATKKNIVAGLNHLIEQAQTKDIIYIHFSTHGQQVIDVDGDEVDGLDEAIIPFDARKTYSKGVYTGENHLIDDELNRYLTSIRKKIGKSGSLLVLIDACHSGDATRGRNEEPDSILVRGTSDVFFAESSKKNHRQTVKPIEWVVISASLPYQNNFEYKMNGEYFGSLSYSVKLAFNELTNENSFSDLFELIKTKRTEMKVAIYPQRPMIDGADIYKNQKAF